MSAVAVNRVSDRVEIVELACRDNFLSETWDLEGMLACDTGDGALDHPAGYAEGQLQLRRYYEGARTDSMSLTREDLRREAGRWRIARRALEKRSGHRRAPRRSCAAAALQPARRRPWTRPCPASDFGVMS